MIWSLSVVGGLLMGFGLTRDGWVGSVCVFIGWAMVASSLLAETGRLA